MFPSKSGETKSFCKGNNTQIKKTVKIVLLWSLKNGSYFDKKRQWKVGGEIREGWQRPRKKERYRPVISPPIGPWPHLSPRVLTGGPHEHPLRGGVQKHSHIFISEPACIDPLSDDNKIT